MISDFPLALFDITLSLTSEDLIPGRKHHMQVKYACQPVGWTAPLAEDTSQFKKKSILFKRL